MDNIIIDVLEQVKLMLWGSRTVSRQKQEPVVGQSIETSLLGSLASNLLGCSCEGHTLYHSTCSQWYIQPAPAEAHKRHTHTHQGLSLSYCLSVCLRLCPSNTSSQGSPVILHPASASVFSSRWAFSHLCQDASLAADRSRKRANWWEENRRAAGEVWGKKTRGEEFSWVFFFLSLNRKRPLGFRNCVV